MNNKQKKMLRAFVTGYSPHKFSLDVLSSELKSRFPFISKISMPQKSSYWKGFAFLDFNSRTDFLTFIREKRIRIGSLEMNLVIKAFKEGKVLQKFVKDVNRRKMHVRGIPPNWNDIKLEQFFVKFGKVENAYVQRKYGEDEELLNGMVIFSAKRSAVECSSLREIEVDQKVHLTLELVVSRNKDGISSQRANALNELVASLGKQSLEIPVGTYPRGKNDNGKEEPRKSYDQSPKQKTKTRGHHHLKPSSRNYFIKSNCKKFRNHKEHRQNIRFNLKNGGSIARGYFIC